MDELGLSKYYLSLNIDDFLTFDIEKLSKLLEYHSDLYYNKEAPIISDYEYDVLFKKLEILEKKFNINEKQTLKVGSEISKSNFEKVKHSRPMISLDNTYNEQDLIDFDEKIKRILGVDIKNKKLSIEYTIEFKFDGLGIELIYDNGILIKAITRGNGIEGEDVTKNIKTIKNIPKNISYKKNLEIRGEVIMPISSFNELNEIALKTGKKIFSNTRNAASGSLRVLDENITNSRNLKFFAYDIGDFKDNDGKIKYYKDLIFFIKDLGFEISSYFPICKNINDVINNIKNFGDKKESIDFDIDGLVIKVNNLSLWQEIGFTAHHPRYAIAYKFPAQIFTTRILSIENQVGRTGTITPVANLEPINISGVIIKRATLHNYEEILNLKININDNVFIKRAGEVIPKIIGVAQKSENNINAPSFVSPKFCPSCNSQLLKDEKKVRIYCPNYSYCPEQIKQKMINSVGKQGLNIDGLGKEQIELFLEKGFIQDIGDIYDLENKKDLILKLPGFKEKSVNNLLLSIEKSKNQNIMNFLVALNIFGVGKQTAGELSKIINSNDDLINFNFSLEELSLLNEIGEETAKNIFNFFSNIKNKILLQNLLKQINIEYKKEVIIGKYTSKKICITGIFENYTRDELIEILESKGGIFVSSISKNTDFLLAGEKAGSKLEKAKTIGVQIINLDEFLN